MTSSTLTRGLSAYRRDLNFLRSLRAPTPATRVLLFVLGGVFVLSYFFLPGMVESRFGEIEEPLLPSILFGAKINAQIQDGAWWRLITHTFLHGNVLHLILNGYGLYFLGTMIERFYGSRRFLLIYGAAGLAGGLASYAFNSAASVGSSGAIFGLFGAVIVFGVRHKASLPPHIARTLSVGMFPWLIAGLAFGLFPRVDNSAHVGGLLVGSALAAILGTPLAKPSLPLVKYLQRGLVAALLALSVASFVFAGRYANHCISSWENWKACEAQPLGEP